MPWTLYRYIVKDLLKVLFLATAVLVLVITVGAAIKPLSDGVLGPVSLVQFVLYSVPTMLGFALPFAAAFASTIVFCRMAADNEVLACRAGGMSYRTILLPVFCIGLLLTLLLFYLSNWVVPTFYLMAERQLEHDMTRLVVNQVRKHQPALFGNMVLYADVVDDDKPPPLVVDSDGKAAAVQPEKLITLEGVAVQRLDDHGGVRQEMTAQRADILLYHEDNPTGDRESSQSWITLELEKFMIYDARKNNLAYMEKSAVIPVRLPNPFKDRLHFLSWDDLKKLGEQPELFDEVANPKQRLLEALAVEEVLVKMTKALDANHAKGPMVLDEGEGQISITAPQVERNSNSLRLSSAPGTAGTAGTPGSSGTAGSPGARVVLETLSDGVPNRRMEAVTAELTVEKTDTDPEPQVAITLRSVRVSDPQVVKGRDTERTMLTLPKAVWPKPVMEDLAKKPATGPDGLLAYVRAQGDPSPAVAAAGDMLRMEVEHLARKIRARLHGRAASAVDCLLVLLLGSVLSLRLRGTMPLVVYFWGFVLATVAVVIARSGENLASSSASRLTIGLGVIWSGNILLAVMVGVIFWQLRRN